jgi:6-pyruvoyltetrahydropterin/6-carboxytetrahydropterin synthase
MGRSEAMTISVTHRYRFSASHRLHCPELSDIENQTLFGKCNNPFGHGHDYVLSVTVAGSVNPESGLICRASDLDRLVQSQVIASFSHRNLNEDLPQFGTLVPTTENVAFTIAEILSEHWNGYLGDQSCRLSRVHVQETDRNSFEIVIDASTHSKERKVEVEEASVHT